MGTFIATVKFRIDGVNDEQEVKDIIKEASDLFQENSIYPYNTLSEPLFEHIDIAEEALRSDVSAVGKYASLDLQGYLVFRYGVVKAPLTLGVKTILLDALNTEVCLTDDREHVPYFLWFCPLRAFLCFWG